jgi:hypothetical protein
MRQGHKRLAAPGAANPNIVLHHRVAAAIAAYDVQAVISKFDAIGACDTRGQLASRLAADPADFEKVAEVRRKADRDSKDARLPADIASIMTSPNGSIQSMGKRSARAPPRKALF